MILAAGDVTRVVVVVVQYIQHIRQRIAIVREGASWPASASCGGEGTLDLTQRRDKVPDGTEYR